MASENIDTASAPRVGANWLKRPFAGATAAAPANTAVAPAQISLRGVSKTFAGRHGTVEALGSVSLSIDAGEFVSIIGPSGCGKSTLMMLVAGLDLATGGTIEIGGKPITKPTSDLGIVFQQDVLLDWRTALDNILLQSQIRGLDLGSARGRARELLAMVGIDGFASSYPHELSGGMRQRVSICRALVHDPPLLLMDEPFGALDALTRDQLQIDLLRLWSRRRMTVLFITHSISEAIFLSDRIVVMTPRPGRIEDVIPIDLPRPRRLAVRETPEFIRYVHRVTDLFKSLGVLRDEDA